MPNPTRVLYPLTRASFELANDVRDWILTTVGVKVWERSLKKISGLYEISPIFQIPKRFWAANGDVKSGREVGNDQSCT